MIIIPTDLTDASCERILSSLDDLCLDNLDISVVHFFEPIKASQISIMNVEDLVYRAKVNQMAEFVKLIEKKFAKSKNKIKGKVRYGDLTSIQNESETSRDIILLINFKDQKELMKNYDFFTKNNLLVICDIDAELSFARNTSKLNQAELLVRLNAPKIENLKIRSHPEGFN